MDGVAESGSLIEVAPEENRTTVPTICSASPPVPFVPGLGDAEGTVDAEEAADVAGRSEPGPDGSRRGHRPERAELLHA